jgi:hypothetical protein
MDRVQVDEYPWFLFFSFKVSPSEGESKRIKHMSSFSLMIQGPIQFRQRYHDLRVQDKRCLEKVDHCSEYKGLLQWVLVRHLTNRDKWFVCNMR